MKPTGQVTTIDVPGGRIAFRAAGAGSPPVVLLHPGYTHHRIWDGHLERLAERVLTVAPDARAHGWSSTPYAPFRQCDDVAALIRHLDAGPAVLVGVSMGAGAAVDTALEHPELVRALVISGAGTNEQEFTDPDVLAILQRVDRAVADQDPRAWLDAMQEFLPGPERSLADVDPAVVARVRSLQEHFVRTHVRPGVVAPTHVQGSWDRLAEITVPVLGIVGELDFPDHLSACRRALESVADGRGVVTIPEAAHFPNLEQPEAWHRIIDEFLTEVGVGSSRSVRPQAAQPRR